MMYLKILSRCIGFVTAWMSMRLVRLSAAAVSMFIKSNPTIHVENFRAAFRPNRYSFGSPSASGAGNAGPASVGKITNDQRTDAQSARHLATTFCLNTRCGQRLYGDQRIKNILPAVAGQPFASASGDGTIKFVCPDDCGFGGIRANSNGAYCGSGSVSELGQALVRVNLC